MNSDFSLSVRAFMKKIFESNPDFSTLTRAKLKREYLSENQCNKFDKDENILFKAIMEEYILKYSESIQESQQTKVLENDDSNINGVVNNTENKKPIAVITAKKKVSKNDGSSSDSDALVIDESDTHLDSNTLLKSHDSQSTITDDQSLLSAESVKCSDDILPKAEVISSKVFYSKSNVDDKKIDSDESSLITLSSGEDKGAGESVESDQEVHQLNSPVTSSNDGSIASPSNISSQTSEDEKKKSVITLKRKKTMNNGKMKRRKVLRKSSSECYTSSDEENLSETVKISKAIKTKAKSAKSKKSESVTADNNQTDPSHSSESLPETSRATKDIENKKPRAEEPEDENSDVTSAENDSILESKKTKSSRRKANKGNNSMSEMSRPVISNGTNNDYSENYSALSDVDVNMKTTAENKKLMPTEPAVESKTIPKNKRIERLKSYIGLAGIRVPSYSKLFESCKSIQSKIKKLLNVLEDAGLEGNPSIAKCKQLKKKLELKKDAESLDVSKIIHSAGRPKRNVCNLLTNASLPVKHDKSESGSDKDENSTKDPFASLRDLVDSDDESDAPVKRTKIKTLSSDEHSVSPVKVSENICDT